MSAPAPFLSRHLGDYLLVAQLSEDPLGTVFRALYAADERRFVRLRVLQSDALSAEAILAAVRNDRFRSGLAHDAIVVRPELDVVEGIPFLTWDETAGWTLDTMLARVRAFGIRIPAEYALLIVERIAAALEHAHLTAIDGTPAVHGLLWPGFVSISHDAVVRVGGFGLSEAVLPGLGHARLTSEIAPYVAPESRREARASRQGDVYSLGAILVELLTGRRPSLETPSAELRAGDPRSEELTTFLRRCLAEPSERFPSAIEAHRALQQLVTGNPFSLFTANLALFLYKLLNPESQSVAPSSDWESTSPVVIETKTRRGESTATATGEMARRRRGDMDPAEEQREVPPLPLPPAASSPPPLADAFPESLPAPLAAEEQVAFLIDEAPAPAPDTGPAQAVEAPALPGPPSWKRPALLLAAAGGVAVGVFLVAGRAGSSPRDAATAAPVPAASASAAPGASPPEAPPQSETPALAAPIQAAESVSSAPRPATVSRPAKKIHPELKQPAEDLRYRAALARIEADRLSARQNAPEAFEMGEESEREGIRFLHERDYDAAQLAFSRAARLFEEARDRSWEERVRGASLTR